MADKDGPFVVQPLSSREARLTLLGAIRTLDIRLARRLLLERRSDSALLGSGHDWIWIPLLSSPRFADLLSELHDALDANRADPDPHSDLSPLELASSLGPDRLAAILPFCDPTALARDHLEPLRDSGPWRRSEIALNQALYSQTNDRDLLATFHLLSPHIRIDEPFCSGRLTAFSRAVFLARLPVVQALLDQGFDPFGPPRSTIGSFGSEIDLAIHLCSRPASLPANPCHGFLLSLRERRALGSSEPLSQVSPGRRLAL